MDGYLQWLLIGSFFCLLAGALGHRVFKRVDAKRKAARAIAEAAAWAETQRLASGTAERHEAERRAAAEEAARAAAARLADAKAARVQSARLAAEEASRAVAARSAREAAAREEATRRTAEEAARRTAEETARRATDDAARRATDEAARRVADEAARVELARQAAEESARAEAARVAAAQAARAQAAQAAEEAARILARAAAEEAAQLEVERLAIVSASLPRAPAVATKRPEQTLVMVADDSKIVRVKTGRLLARHQYRVSYAIDGLDAAQQMQTSIPDVVITDVEMPGMDGFELTRHVRTNPLTAHIPIIMITAADDRHRDDASRAGVSVLLGKPYPEEELIEYIRAVMQHGETAAGALA